MTREQALKLVEEKISNKNLVKHCLAVEAIMKELAELLTQNTESWALAGLLHDIDYEETKDEPEQHSLKSAEMLADLGLPEEITYAVKVHNEIHGLPRQSMMDKALYAVDPLTGLITASALILPSKKLADLTAESILKRFKEPRFAAGANREAIASIKELEIDTEKFIEIGLRAMQKISDNLGL